MTLPFSAYLFFFCLTALILVGRLAQLALFDVVLQLWDSVTALLNQTLNKHGTLLMNYLSTSPAFA